MLMLLGASIAFVWTMLALSFTAGAEPPAVMIVLLWPAYLVVSLGGLLGGFYPVAMLVVAALGALVGLALAWLIGRY
jgi:hypothetical protein